MNNGERISSGSALLLFVLTFFDWFGVKSSDGSLGLFSVGHSAWQALDYIPIVLVLAIIATLAMAVERVTSAAHRSAIAVNAVVAILGLVSALLILFRIVDPPNFGSFWSFFEVVTYEGTVQPPIFLALLAAAGIAVGGCLAMREEGFSLSALRARRLSPSSARSRLPSSAP